MKKISVFLILFFFLISNNSKSQSPIIDWRVETGGNYSFSEPIEENNKILLLSDGSTVSIGYTKSVNNDVNGNHGNYDIWVQKLSSTGVLIWQKTYGGTGFDLAYSIDTTIDGGFVFSGYSSSNDGDVTGNHGDADIWVVKLNSLGNIIWQKCIGGTSGDYAYSIKTTADGGSIISGGTYSIDGDVFGNHGLSDVYVVKLNSTGVIEWNKCYGGSDYDYSYSCIQSNDGGYVFTGTVRSNNGDASGNHGGQGDIWAVKLTSTGVIQWQKCLGGSSFDNGFSIIQTNDNGFLISG